MRKFIVLISAVFAISLFGTGVAVVDKVVAPQVAQAHGHHHSPIKPAYDCYFNKFGRDTQGDVDITHDWDLQKYVVWKCKCEWLDSTTFRCWWRFKGWYTWREDAVRRARELKGPHHKNAQIRTILVEWNAWHGVDGCARHIGHKPAVIWEKRG